MKRVPYDVKKGMYLLLLREGGIAIEEFYRKAYFVTGRHREIMLQAYIRNTKGIERDHNDIVRLNAEECPVWLQYAIFAKKNGAVKTTDITRRFGHTYNKVYNETRRYPDIFSFTKVGGKNVYELKICNVGEKEADKL